MYERHICVQLHPLLYFPHDFAIMSTLNAGVDNTRVLKTVHVRGSLKRHNITMTNLHHAVDTEVITLKSNGKLYKMKMPNSIHATLPYQLKKNKW